MASSSMASAASGFMVATPNVTSNSAPKSSMLSFSSKNNTTNIPRLVVRAAEEAAEAAPPAATATATAEGEAPPAKAVKPPQCNNRAPDPFTISVLVLLFWLTL